MGREGALNHSLLACGGLWSLRAVLDLSGNWGGSWQGSEEGGDNGSLSLLSFSPSKMLRPLDKYDFILP